MVHTCIPGYHYCSAKRTVNMDNCLSEATVDKSTVSLGIGSVFTLKCRCKAIPRDGQQTQS